MENGRSRWSQESLLVCLLGKQVLSDEAVRKRVCASLLICDENWSLPGGRCPCVCLWSRKVRQMAGKGTEAGGRLRGAG